MEQQRLYRLAHESIQISAIWQRSGYWTLDVRARRQDEPWAEADRLNYEVLDAAELADALDASVRFLLGL